MRLFATMTLFLASAVAAASKDQANSTASYCPSRPATPEQQRAIFEKAVQTIIVEQRYEEGIMRHYDEGYIQHDPYVIPGRQNALDFLNTLDPDLVNFTIVNKGIDNQHAWIFQRVDQTGNPNPLGWVDLWRMEGTCMMEHWSIYMPKPADATNPLPLW
ncbi:integron gene cassette protein [Colletotrichum sojae]|uniref:Integron gene cassette protein n=1 Tax=Colletotrichum sojae TaxID=2175907 RepID=A0A8H6IM82_9PEZI|nr:integron gene cassette protein [Colletotrichum sojae]